MHEKERLITPGIATVGTGIELGAVTKTLLKTMTADTRKENGTEALIQLREKADESQHAKEANIMGVWNPLPSSAFDDARTRKAYYAGYSDGYYGHGYRPESVEENVDLEYERGYEEGRRDCDADPTPES